MVVCFIIDALRLEIDEFYDFNLQALGLLTS